MAQVLAGLGGILGLGALAAWYFGETLKELLPAPHEIARRLRVWRGAVVPATGTQFAILVADLDGDTDGRQTRRVRDAFLGLRGLDVNAIGRKVALADLGNLTEGQIEAEKRGRALLEEYNGDLLVWGEVRAADKELALWFLNRDGASTLGAPSYMLTEKLALPVNFQEALAAQLQAMALARLAPARPRSKGVISSTFCAARRKS